MMDQGHMRIIKLDVNSLRSFILIRWHDQFFLNYKR